MCRVCDKQGTKKSPPRDVILAGGSPPRTVQVVAGTPCPHPAHTYTHTQMAPLQRHISTEAQEEVAKQAGTGREGAVQHPLPPPLSHSESHRTCAGCLCLCRLCSLTAAFEAMLDEATRDGFITPADDIRQSSQRQHPVQLHQQQQPPRQQQQHRQRGYDVDTGMQVERASGAGGGAGAGVGAVGGGAPTGASSGAATGAESEVAAEFAELVRRWQSLSLAVSDSHNLLSLFYCRHCC